jgi:hypothetical protein
VITTNQSSDTTQQILASCNTSALAPSTLILRTVLTLCDDSEIKALQGSNDLNITTDPSLKCINEKFNSLCGLNSLSTLAIAAIVVVLAILAGCCYGIYKRCCPEPERPEEKQPMTPSEFWDEYDRRRACDRACNNLARLCTIL